MSLKHVCGSVVRQMISALNDHFHIMIMLNPSVAELELRTHEGQTISGLSEMQPRLVLVPGVVKLHLGGISRECGECF